MYQSSDVLQQVWVLNFQTTCIQLLFLNSRVSIYYSKLINFALICFNPFNTYSCQTSCVPGISCVVPKGEWLKRLGLGEAVNYVGTEESICIRVPDSSVLCYIVSLHGPIALTSANLSGGPDSTHHSMVVTTLGMQNFTCLTRELTLFESCSPGCSKVITWSM